MSNTLRLIPWCPDEWGPVLFVIERDWSPYNAKKQRKISRERQEEKRRQRRTTRQEVRRAHLVEQ